MLFEDLGLIDPICKALKDEGYVEPTPIQAQAIPIILKKRDLLGCAQTGTGKTAAFAIPILQLLHEAGTVRKGRRPIKATILTPTRELAIQIGESFAAYGKYTGLRHLVIYGGVPQGRQTNALKAGVDILVATPGRLIDLINQGYVHLDEIQLFVLDEADRMLDMGFIHDIRKVLQKIPEDRQSLFFSATMPKNIVTLSNQILSNPAKVEISPTSSAAETVQQSVYFVVKREKRGLLIHLLKTEDIPSALVFSRTKHGADRIARDLKRANIRAEAIHGDKSQNARQRALKSFKDKRCRVLVATDIAARGIDVEDLTHVINFNLPNLPETYVHRIGRTGRAGASGVALSFCDDDEKAYLRDIQRLIQQKLKVVDGHPFPMTDEKIAEQLDYQAKMAEMNPRGRRSSRPSRHGGGGNRSQRKPKNQSNNKSSDQQQSSSKPKGQSDGKSDSQAPKKSNKKKWWGNKKKRV